MDDLSEIESEVSDQMDAGNNLEHGKISKRRECMRVKSGGTASTFWRGPSFSNAANRFDLTSAGDISVVGDPAPKNKLIAHHVTAC